jgi:hypothetical protein
MGLIHYLIQVMHGGSKTTANDVYGITYAGALDCSLCDAGSYADAEGARPSSAQNMK